MDYSLKPVYVVSMVDFPLAHESEEAVENDYISRYELRNGRNGEVMTQSLNFVFLELARLKLRATEAEKCRGLLERFVFSLKYMHKLKAKPESFEDDLLERLFKATELASMTVTTRQNYDKIMRTELDRLAENAFAREQGMAKGKAEGLAEGKAEEKIAIARAMLAEKIEPALVAKCTGLTEKKVGQLKAKGMENVCLPETFL